jgi:hypothetical protein
VVHLLDSTTSFVHTLPVEGFMTGRSGIAIAVGLIMLVARMSFAGTVTFKVGEPKVPASKTGSYDVFPATLMKDPRGRLVLMPILSTQLVDQSVISKDTQKSLFAAVVKELDANTKGTPITVTPNNNAFTVTLGNVNKVDDYMGIVIRSAGTGIDETTIRAKDDPSVAFINWGTDPHNPTGSDHFALTDADGHSTTFTAGVATNLGIEVLTLAASSFPVTGTGSGSYIAGSDIAEVFDKMLAPLLPAIGATVSLNGGELDFEFAPGTTTPGGGGIGGAEVDFGTTSGAGIVSGGIDTAVPEPQGFVLMASGMFLLYVTRLCANIKARKTVIV